MGEYSKGGNNVKRLTVKELIEQLQEHDGEKIVFVDDTMDGELVGIRGVYRINSNDDKTEKDLNGHVYLGMVD